MAHSDPSLFNLPCPACMTRLFVPTGRTQPDFRTGFFVLSISSFQHLKTDEDESLLSPAPLTESWLLVYEPAPCTICPWSSYPPSWSEATEILCAGHWNLGKLRTFYLYRGLSGSVDHAFGICTLLKGCGSTACLANPMMKSLPAYGVVIINMTKSPA